MSSIRGYIVAGLIISVLVGLGGASFLLTNTARQQASIEQKADAKAYAYAHRANVTKEGRCRPLAAPSRFECEQEENQTAREGQHNEYDLKAQQVTAIWTRAMGIAAIAGTGFGIIGVTLVLGTFWENKRAADAAHEANRAWLRLQVGEKEERCTLWVKPDALEFSAPVILTNYGRSPALDVWTDGFITFDRPSFGEVSKHITSANPEDRHGRTILFPEVPEGTQLEFTRKGERPDSAPIFLTVFVKYKVVGDRKWHHTAYIFTTSPGDSATIFYGSDGDNLRLNYGDIHQHTTLSLHRGRGGLPIAT